MRMLTTTLLALTAGALTAAPAAAQAAAAGQQPNFHVVTVSTFRVPLGPDRPTVIGYIRKWMAGPAKLNPKVVSYRVLQHWYGANAGDMAIAVEYASWADVTAPCEPCQQWFQENMPAEGTPERKAVDEAQALFIKYYGSHQDNIYTMDMSMAKP